MWKYSSYWYKDFDGMAYKTMLRQLISKWGIMSIDLQTAFEGDMAVINEDGTKNYVENDDEIIETPIVEESSVVEVDATPTNDAEAALFGN
jgi:recombination protein RecT